VGLWQLERVTGPFVFQLGAARPTLFRVTNEAEAERSRSNHTAQRARFFIQKK
jgi:hypothetical protein